MSPVADPIYTGINVSRALYMKLIHRQYENLTLIGIVVLAALMRGITLGSADIWQDEYFTALFYEERALSIKNFLTYALISLSQSVFGENQIALRLPTFFFGVAAVYAIYLLGREIKSTSVGLLSAAFLAILPWHLFHSQYARYYAVVVFFTILLHLFFIRALRRDSLAYLLAAGVAAALAVSSHVTAVLAPFSIWIFCCVMFFQLGKGDNCLSTKIVRTGFWLGIACALIALPFFVVVLVEWVDVLHGWTRSPAQQIFQYYTEVGVLSLLALCAIWIERTSRDRAIAVYLGITFCAPALLVITATMFTSIRGDYGICFVVPAIAAAAIGVNLTWSSAKYGRELATLLVLLVIANAAPRLLSHYTDRLANYSTNATNFLLQQRRSGDRVATFVPGVRYYLEQHGIDDERVGVSIPENSYSDWPNRNFVPQSERLWLVFKITRRGLAPPVIDWLRENRARIVWRQNSIRLDSVVRGVEIFLICPSDMKECDSSPELNSP